MPRKLTVRNPNHPHNQLSDFLEKLKGEYRRMSTTALTNTVSVVYSMLAKQHKQGGCPAQVLPKFRHQQIEFLLTFHEDKFKKEWKLKYGWPFSDVYDREKMQLHQAEDHAANLSRSKEPLITEQMLKEAEQTATTGNKRDKERFQHMHTVIAMMRAGLAGVTADGIIVDRRRRNVICAPVPKNDVLPSAEPVEVTEDMRIVFAAELERKALEEAESVPPTDLEKIEDEDGKEYTREEFDKLPQDKKDDIRTYRGHLLQLITKAGYAGMLPGGKLVDRRVRPEAIPVQKNQMFGAPEPKKLPAPLQEVKEVMEEVGAAFGGKFAGEETELAPKFPPQ